VRFLSSAVFLRAGNLVFDNFHLELPQEAEGYRLSAELDGAPLARIDKEIKAVTYHNLAVRQTERGLEARVVFDV
jgi:SHS2 domain-containing protein